MVFTKVIKFETKAKLEEINLSELVGTVVYESKVKDGIVTVFSGHTTGGIYLSNTDHHLPKDIESFFEELVPNKPSYLHNRHGGRNTSSHLKSVIFGNSLTLPISNGKIDFGRWQAVFFAELDGPRKREVVVKILGE